MHLILKLLNLALGSWLWLHQHPNHLLETKSPNPIKGTMKPLKNLMKNYNKKKKKKKLKITQIQSH